MTLKVFLALLLIVSTFTGLFTEGAKKLLDEWNKKYKANTLAGFVAVVISILVGIAYAVLMSVAVNSDFVVYFVALVLMSWLCAMVGYDKVIQTITQARADTSDNK